MHLPNYAYVSRNRGANADVNPKADDPCPHSLDVERIDTIQYGEARCLTQLSYQRTQRRPSNCTNVAMRDRVESQIQHLERERKPFGVAIPADIAEINKGLKQTICRSRIESGLGRQFGWNHLNFVAGERLQYTESFDERLHGAPG